MGSKKLVNVGDVFGKLIVIESLREPRWTAEKALTK